MTDTLFIRLRNDTTGSSATDPAVACCVLREDGSAPIEHLAPAALAARAAGHRVVAFIPAADVLALTVSLPPMSIAKARAALPYALEDQLAGELESQHFVLGPRLADGRWTVRVIARARVEHHRATLRAMGIEPEAIVSEADALRDKPGDLMLWLDRDEAHWRAPGQQTVSLPADALMDGATLALRDTPAATLGLRAHAEPDDLARHSLALEALGGQFLQLATQSLSAGALPWLAAQYDPSQAVNLLHGELAPQRRHMSGGEAWRWPARLAVAAFALWLLGWGIDAWRVQQAAAPVDAALLAAVRPLDPAAGSPGTARASLQARLADWDRREQDASRTPLIRAAAALAEARTLAPTLQVLALQQREDGQVTARFGVDDAALRETVRATLLAAGWRDATGDAGATTEFSLVWGAPP